MPKFPNYQTIDGLTVIASYLPDAVRSALAYKPQEDDLFVVTFPKCGTTWTQCIVYLILNKGKPYKNSHELMAKIPYLELFGADAMDKLPRPEAIKIHLDFKRTPYSPLAKYIHVVRNPKDTCVSFYHHTLKLSPYEFDGTFDDFFEIFFNGQNDYGDYFEHTLSWYEHRNDPNVLFLTYEELKSDTRNAILKMAKFIGDDYEKILIENPDIMENVLKYSSIEQMKKFAKIGPSEPTPPLEFFPSGIRHFTTYIKEKGLAPFSHDDFVRKGIIGDWKNHFNEEQAKKLDDKTREKLAGTDLLKQKLQEETAIYFHHTLKLSPYEFDGTFDDFFEIFFNGQNDYGDYFEHTLSWYEHRNDPNVLFLTYEELKSDTRNAILKMAKFIGDDYEKILIENPDIMENVLKYSSIEQMKKFAKIGPSEPTPPLEFFPSGIRHFTTYIKEKGLAPFSHDDFVRKGIIGDWKNHFNEEQAKKLDDKTREKLAGTDLLKFWQKLGILE
ncbi:hypothetical protein LAZ67_20000137 [Cordylochernes scorpioides]|uniref:Sulfotransferase domain-containing protein n=1 Tax=Cordylochernes scorpioides TaxID=51811 RepID=A0ABY6LLS7_9ARAC|nr:hypothetical protein LAZ67_20000137 [Cordylochernes scorpioides]